MTHRDIIKLNLGCGPSGIDGWLNYDWGVLPILSKLPWIRKFLINFKLLSPTYDVDWPQIKLVDINKKLPLASNSIDYIYCSHVLEHFEKYESKDIVNECYRVLKNGGLMRIVLPDLRNLVEQYDGAESFNKKFFGYEKDIKSLSNLFVRGHRWMYDKKSVVSLLENCFKNINFEKWKEGKCPDIDRLDLKCHRDHSLYVEVIKK